MTKQQMIQRTALVTPEQDEFLGRTASHLTTSRSVIIRLAIERAMSDALFLPSVLTGSEESRTISEVGAA